MNTNAMHKRLAALEAERHREYGVWLESLTQDELEAFVATFPLDPELDDALDRLSAADLERACAGEIHRDEVLRLAQGRTVRYGSASAGYVPPPVHTRQSKISGEATRP